MDGPAATAVMVLSLVLAAWAGVLLALNRFGGRPLLAGIVVLEVAVVALAVAGLGAVAGDRTFDKATFVGYLLAMIVIPPGAAWWAWGERNRAGTAVLLVVFLLMPVLVLRLQQIWTGSGV